MIAPDGRFQFRIVEIKDILYSLFKGIDDRIPCYGYLVLLHTFRQQIFLA